MAKIKIYRGIKARTQAELDDYVKAFYRGEITPSVESVGADFFTFTQEQAEEYARSNRDTFSHIFVFEVDENLIMDEGQYANLLRESTDYNKVHALALKNPSVKDADSYVAARVKELGYVGVHRNEFDEAEILIYDRKEILKGPAALAKMPKGAVMITSQLDFWNYELDRISIKNYAVANNKLFANYQSTLAEIKKELRDYIDNYENLTFSQRLEAERLFRTAGQIDSILGGNSEEVNQIIKDYKTADAMLGYNGAMYSLEGRYRMVLEGFGLDKKFIENVVNSPVAGKRLSTRLYKNREKLARETTNMIIRETSKGKGYAHIARRITELTEANYKQSLRIARTEAGRVRTITTQRGYDDAVDLGVDGLQKRWVSGLDGRTRDSHGAADGQTVDHDEDFIVGDARGPGPRMTGDAGEDINCRCTTIPIVDNIAPELRLVDGEYQEYKTYSEWRKSKNV